MIGRTELGLIRTGFSISHVYSLAEYPATGRSKHELEISHYEGACFVLIHLVHLHCVEDKPTKAKWIVDMIFSYGKVHLFPTSKDTHVHVMVALDTLTNVSMLP